MSTSKTRTTESPFMVVRAGLRLLARFIREHPSAYALAATGAILFTSAIVASAFVIGYITDELIEPVLVGDAPLGDRLLVAVGLVLGVGLWKMMGIILRRTAAGWLQFGAQARLRKRIIAHELELPMSWYGQRAVGDLLSVSDNDARQATWVLAPLPFATGVVFLLVATAAVVTWTDVWLGVAALGLLGLVVGLDIHGSWLTFAAMEEAQRRRGRVGDIAHESVDGALTVKALGRADLEVSRFRDGAESLRDQLIEVGRRWTFYRAITEGLPAVGIVVILFLGAIRMSAGALEPGELVRVAYLLALLAVPVRLVGYLTWEIAHSVAGWERVEEILSITDVIRYGELPTVSGDGGAAVTGEAVVFGYEPGIPVIGGLELDISAGRTLAIVGPTASGKSTLARLLARLWDPDAGVIRLDGRDLRDLGRGVVPGEVAFVSQDTFLFDDTVEGNITLGLDVDHADVVEAVRLAGADRFIADLPHGYETRVGERGTTLSGGQQQRIALARALVRRPRLLVLDDATSAVDPSVETDILRGLKRADLPSTVLVVAYRRSSIVLADEVVYMEDGRIVAHGSHEELMQTVPGYVALLSAYEDDAATTRSR